MTDSPNHHFRLNPRSQVCDANGDVLFTATSVNSVTGATSSAGNEQYLRQLSHPTRSRSEPVVCFVRDVQAADTLQQVFLTVARDLAFCVIPASADSTAMAEADALSASCEPGVAANAFDLPQFQCMSSGTSGAARRIQRSHLSWIRSFEVNAEQLQIGPQDRYAIVGSLSHSLPLYAALEACHLGAEVQILTELRPDRQLAAIDRLGTTVLYMTPTQARQLCQARSAGTDQVHGIRHVLCGGGKLDARTRGALQNLFDNASITEFYGASETSFITMSTAQTPPGSVGHAYPGVALKILDEHDEETRDVGEIWVSSEYLFTRYTQGSWRDTRRLDGFLSIGEMGQLDEQGNLFLAGRRSRKANVADTTVFLEEIEAVMMQQGAVHHCVVVSRENAMRGETLVAVVEGSEDETLRKQLLKFARQQLGAILAPREIVFVENMPSLAAGKPDILQIERMVQAP